MANAKVENLAIIDNIRQQFPMFSTADGIEPVAYLDSAATAQKPQVVIDCLRRFYAEQNANIHRGVYRLSQEATEAFEQARGTIAAALGIADSRSVVFTRGATESINLVAHGLAGKVLKRGDHILLTEMEHHANIVPWQLLRDRMGIGIEVVRVTPSGELDMDDFEDKLRKRPALLSFVHVSNSLGTVNPAAAMIQAARALEIPVLLDASQTVPHGLPNVAELDPDFMVFSGHKVFGPTGIGVLYGRYELLQQFAPYQGGGDMIESVSFNKTVYKDPPARFEAGTPHIAGAIGLGVSIDWLRQLPQAELHAHEQALLAYATEQLSAVPGLRIIGTAAEKVAVVSFVMECAHSHDVASVLDAAGVAVRAGHHCTQPLMHSFGISGTVRASMAFYNTFNDVDRLVAGLQKVRRLFGAD